MSVANAGLVPSKTTLTGRVVVGVVSPENARRARVKRMRRTVLNSCRSLLRQRRGFRDKWKMVTLTYSPENQWAASDVRDFLQRVRMWMKRKGWHFSYVWVMELMQSGVPHFHVLIRTPYRATLPKADAVGWWTKGITNTVTARNAVGYLAKYASKGKDQGEFPKGARIHGAAGLNPESKTYVQFWNLPVWARSALNEVQKTKKIKGGYVALCTGLFLPTPYEVIFQGGVILIVEKEI